MAKKNRRFQQVAATPNEPQQATRYEDAFQSKVGKSLEGLERSFAGNGRTLLYVVIGVVVLGIVIFAVTTISRRSGAAGQAALGKAIETSQARITDTPVAGSTDKTFKTEKERSDAAIAEFQAVVDKFGGSVGEKAKYFIAVNKLYTDRAAGITDLEGISAGSSDTAKLAKFALAQTRAEDGRFDDAVTLYQELAGMSDAVIAKDTINFNLAGVYEKQNKVKEAADIYFNIAKTASDAKDADGASVPLTETARDAKDKLTALDPARAKEISTPEPANPFGGM